MPYPLTEKVTRILQTLRSISGTLEVFTQLCYASGMKALFAVLRLWLDQHAYVRTEIASGDLRTRFDSALPQQDRAVFVSFETLMFNRVRRNETSGRHVTGQS